MKLFSSMFAAACLAAAVAGGCSETPHRMSKIEPMIQLSPKASMQVNEVKRVTATTENVAGAKAIVWSVTPNVGKISAENNVNGQTALFTADQAGVYVVSARVDLGNGQSVSAETAITVNGRPMMSSEK